MAALVVANHAIAGGGPNRRGLVPDAQVERVPMKENDRLAGALLDDMQRHPVVLERHRHSPHRAVAKVNDTALSISLPPRSSTASAASVTWIVSPAGRSARGCHTSHQCSAS